MDIFLGIILIISYVGMVVYAIKGKNLMIGFFIMTLLWAVLSGTDVFTIQKDVFEATIESSASTVFAVIFGSWFGRILIETGIINGIIKKVVELGGDHVVLTVNLLTIVTAAIFSSVYGVGTTIAVAMITLPIMFSLGVPKNIAITSFCFAHSAGMFVNPSVFSQLKAYWEDAVYQGNFFRFAVICMCIHLVIAVIMLTVRLTRKGVVTHAWAAEAPRAREEKKLFFLAYITPVVPVLMVAFAKWEIIPSIIVTMILALLFSGKLRKPGECVELLLKTLRDGTSDVALLIGLMFSIWCFAKAAKLCGPLLSPFITPILPGSVLLIAVIFGILCPLGLFRGPITLSGVGAATTAILISSGKYAPLFTMLLIYCPWLCMTFGTCPTQSTNAWLLNYAKSDLKSHFKSTLPYTWISCLVCLVVAALFFSSASFGG